jgi:hypothetical protein
VTVTQTGAPCSLAITPASNTFTSAARSASFSVSAPTGCAWTTLVAYGNTSWLSTPPGASGSGNGSVTYSALQNQTKRPRTGRITVSLTPAPPKSKVFTLTQSK